MTGTRPRLIRPPYGKDVARVARVGHDAGLAPTVLWSAQAWDWEETSADWIAERIVSDARPGGIALLHDGAPPYDDRPRDATVAALAQILERLADWELVTVSELLEA